MTTKLETLEAALRNALGDHMQSLMVALGEMTVRGEVLRIIFPLCACCMIMPIYASKN